MGLVCYHHALFAKLAHQSEHFLLKNIQHKIIYLGVNLHDFLGVSRITELYR